MMRSLVSFELLGVLVFIRRQQLAPNSSIGSCVARQVYRNAWRSTKTIKRTVKHVRHQKRPNLDNIQVMELVFNKGMR